MEPEPVSPCSASIVESVTNLELTLKRVRNHESRGAQGRLSYACRVQLISSIIQLFCSFHFCPISIFI